MGLSTRGRLLAIIMLAVVLRAIGLGFGLPYLSNFYVRPDETLIVLPALRLFEVPAPPTSLVYPALMSTLCAALFHVYGWIAPAITGASVPSRAADFVRDPTPYVLLARSLSVVAGTVTVLLVYLVGREFGRRVGLLAALLYAIAPLAVRDAHFGVTDTLMTMLSTAAVYALLRYHRAPPSTERRWIAGGAVAIGLAVSTKYPALVLAPLAVGVVIGQDRPRAWRRVAAHALILLGVALLVFLAVNSRALFHPRDTAVEVARVVRAISRQETGWSLLPALGRVAAPLRYGPGEVTGLLAAALATGLAWRRAGDDRWRVAIVAGALGVFLVPLLMARILPFRYALPALPFVAVLAAQGILSARWPGPPAVSRWVTGLLILGCVLPPLGRAIWIDALLAREDTRSQAGRWIAEQVPADVPVVLLAGPECEPQILETRASLARRSQYAMERYGPQAGRVVSDLYRLQLEWRPELAGNAHEVFRGPAAPERAGRGVCLVIPSYPLPNPACPTGGSLGAFTDVSGAAIVRTRFDAITRSPWCVISAGLPARRARVVISQASRIGVWSCTTS